VELEDEMQNEKKQADEKDFELATSGFQQARDDSR
jgi:hypothetical protein